MPRYLVQRTFPDGLQIPVGNGGPELCQTVVERNAEEGVTWLHSYVSADKRTTFCVYGPPRATARTAMLYVCRRRQRPVATGNRDRQEGARTEQAPFGSTAARPAPKPACHATKYLQMCGRRVPGSRGSRTATNANRWIPRVYSRRTDRAQTSRPAGGGCVASVTGARARPVL